jgi:hypothetical protein
VFNIFSNEALEFGNLLVSFKKGIFNSCTFLQEFRLYRFKALLEDLNGLAQAFGYSYDDSHELLTVNAALFVSMSNLKNSFQAILISLNKFFCLKNHFGTLLVFLIAVTHIFKIFKDPHFNFI